MTNLMERLKDNPELKRKLTKKMFQLGWIGGSHCVRQNELDVGEDGTVLLEHPIKQCPLNIAIRDIPAEYQPITANPSIKIKVQPDVHQGHLAGDVVGGDCFAQKIDTERVKQRQEVKDPELNRKIKLRKDLIK